MKTADQGQWLERAEAARRLAVPPRRVKALAEAGEIRVRRLAGVRAIYSASDVERLARGPATDPPRTMTPGPDGDHRP